MSTICSEEPSSTAYVTKKRSFPFNVQTLRLRRALRRRRNEPTAIDALLDDGNEDDASTSAVKELSSARADALDLRCLFLCIGMLEGVNGSRQFVRPPSKENSTLEGILGKLIIRIDCTQDDHDDVDGY